MEKFCAWGCPKFKYVKSMVTGQGPIANGDFDSWVTGEWHRKQRPSILGLQLEKEQDMLKHICMKTGPRKIMVSGWLRDALIALEGGPRVAFGVNVGLEGWPLWGHGIGWGFSTRTLAGEPNRSTDNIPKQILHAEKWLVPRGILRMPSHKRNGCWIGHLEDIVQHQAFGLQKESRGKL